MLVSHASILIANRREEHLHGVILPWLDSIGVQAQLFRLGEFHIDVQKPPHYKMTNQAYNYHICLRKIIQWNIDNGINSFLFVEDDAEPQPNFNQVMNRVEQEIGEFDMLYLGANHHASNTYWVTDHLLKCSNALDMHVVIINSSIYSKLLWITGQGREIPDATADGVIANCHTEYKIYAAHPQIVYQIDGISGNDGCFYSRKKNWQHPGCLNDIRGRNIM